MQALMLHNPVGCFRFDLTSDEKVRGKECKDKKDVLVCGV